MSNKKKNRIRRNNKKGDSFFKRYRRIIIVLLELFIVCLVFKYAQNYVKDDNDLKIYINSDNVSFKYEPFIEDGTLYLSIEDVDNFLDANTYYEENNNEENYLISISGNKIIRLIENSKEVEINDTVDEIEDSFKTKEGIYYLPISDIESVYNIEIQEHTDNNIINIDKLSKEKKSAYLQNNTKLKYKDTIFSRTIENLKKDEQVTIVNSGEKWTKVQSTTGNVGYVKTNKLSNEEVVRETLDFENEIVVEDSDNISELSNDDIEGTIDDITLDYDSRKEFILRIVDTAISNRLDGVRVNFDNVENEENYYRFLAELKPYLNDYGISLIVVKKDNLDDEKLQNVTNEVQ